MHISQIPSFRMSLAFTRAKESPFPCEFWTTNTNERVVIFSKGKWALKELALGIIKQKCKGKGRIYIPGYFCEISLTPLRIYDFDLHFYRITPNFEPDIAHLNEIGQKYGMPDILLYVHYFGFPSNMLDTKRWCKQNNVLMVEDAAHSLVPITGIGDNGNPVIYTPWKFINVPDSSILVLPLGYEYINGKSCEKNGTISYPLNWIAKQMLFSIAQYMRLPVHRLRKIRIKGHDESESPLDPQSPLCSVFSIGVLSQYGRYIDVIRTIRERNYRRLDEIFLQTRMSTYRLYKNLPVLFAPYVYPLRVPENRSIEIMVALNKKGIHATPWSDLSPEVKNSSEFPLSNALRREIVTLPIHQDLSLIHIEWMAKEVMKLL